MIKILSHACGLKDLLSYELGKLGFAAELVDYNKPLIPQINDADVLVNGLGRVDKTMIDACSRLKLVHQVGIGVDNVDIEYCTSKSIFVANVPHSNHVSVAEHTIFFMIYLAKNIKCAETGLMKRRVINVLGTELKGKTLIIIGLGATGTEVAFRSKALGLKVIALTRHPEKKQMAKKLYLINDIKGVDKLPDLLPQADFVSIHTPLTDETIGMIGSRQFELMKASAYLINVARAPIVSKKELFLALSERKIAGAAFDVFWEEPANPNDNLLNLDNFVLTPHIAGWTKEAACMAVSTIVDNIYRISRGISPLTVVNSISRVDALKHSFVHTRPCMDA